MEAFIAHWGYLAILGGTVLEGEAVLVAAGAMAHQGLLALPWVIAAAGVGGLVGDQMWFLLGRRYGTPFLQKRPKLQERASVVQTWLDKYGTLFLIGFRFMYGLRSVTPVLLGATNFPVRRFALFNVIGAVLWSVSFGLIGYSLGAGFKALFARHGHAHEHMLAGVVVALVIALFVFLRMRRRARLARAAAPSTRLGAL
jgi:membrane protein DedA with SNARE-associated domain